MSHASFVYLDDGISGHNCRTDASAASIIQKNDLSLSGFKTNDEKCHWQPMQIGEWLGMIINPVKFQFQILQRKIEKVKKKHCVRVGLQLCFISAIGEDRGGFYQFTLFGCRPTSQAFLATTFFS